jgi:pimeloyl-ACP methyl ester carboxylesterase
MNFKKLKICVFLVSVLLLSSGCATLGKTDIHIAKSGKKIEYLLLENNASTDTVVFENGLGGKMEYWAKVIPEVSKKATVFAYNRPGYGKSDEVDTDRDAEHVVEELRAMLAQKGLKAPYILVGHSLGGLYMQYFARRYPNEIKALVLVDSTHPRQFDGDGSPDNWPAWFRFVFFNIALTDTGEKEFALIGKSGKDTLALPTFDKTVIVLSASKPMQDSSKPADYANKLRKELAALYPHSKQIWVDSGHVIPLEKPEAVISAIKEATEAKAR